MISHYQRTGYVDAASLSRLTQRSGGEFTLVTTTPSEPTAGAAAASDAISAAVARALPVRPVATDAVFRVRASEGLAVARLRELNGVGDAAKVCPHAIHASLIILIINYA